MSSSPPDVVTIRAMRPDDLAEVVAIEAASYSMPWGVDTFRALLRRAESDLLVAERDGGVAGYAVWWHTLDQGELGNVAVAAAWRRRGIASRLVRETLRRATQRGVREMFLEVRESNHGARHLYEALGFTAVGVRRGYYIRPVEDAVIMRSELR